ncbi:MAG TPA: hypothetical protein VG266_07800 [Candidatus Dormibacteraeota bacterium]|nr:hypothetical protein [Candidatus Dormibacteraeota bacterium]
MIPSPTRSERPAADGEDERRPTALLLIYTWDILLAIGALIEGVFAPFGGAVQVGDRTLPTPVAVQILEAISSAALGGALILIGTLLTRHDAWVRRAQVVVLSMAAGIGAASYAVVAAVARTIDVAGMLGTALLVLVDLVALYALTAHKVVAWYRDPGPVPMYMGALITFWAATSVAFVTLRALS